MRKDTVPKHFSGEDMDTLADEQAEFLRSNNGDVRDLSDKVQSMCWRLGSLCEHTRVRYNCPPCLIGQILNRAGENMADLIIAIDDFLQEGPVPKKEK